MNKKLSLFLVFTLLFAAFGTATAQDSDISGEITVHLQVYYRPDQHPEHSAIAEQVAAEYMEMHPNATINLLPDTPDTAGSTTWLAARMAAGEAPDIVWDHWFNRNRILDTWWAPLDEYFELPNPYIPEGTAGHERWMDSFDEGAMNTTRAPDGHWYQVSLDWVETALYYNVAMFEEAGVEADWANWGEFIADMKTLQDTLGVEAFGSFMPGTGWNTWYWADSLWLSAVWADKASELYMDKFSALQPDLDWRQLNAEEYAKAIHDGVLNAHDPRMDHYLRISKDYAEILPIDFMGITSLGDVMRMWLGEQLAIYWGGTWDNKEITNSAAFEWGLSFLPPFTEDDFEGAPGTIYRTGGPSSAGQYGIPASTAEGDNFELAVDYLMWMSAPQNFGPLANTFGGFIPMVAGTEMGPVLANFQAVAALQDRLFGDPSARLTIEHGDNWTQLMQGYFLGATDEEETKALLQESWEKGTAALCEANNFDWCP